MIHVHFRCEERHETSELLYTSLEALEGSPLWGEPCGYCERPLNHAMAEARGLDTGTRDLQARLDAFLQPFEEALLSTLEKDLHRLLDLVECAGESYWPKGHMDRLEVVAREMRARYAL